MNQKLANLLGQVNHLKKDLYYYHLAYAYYRTECKNMEALTKGISMIQDGQKYQPYVMNKFMRDLEAKLGSTSPIRLLSLDQYDAFKKSFFLFSLASHPGSIDTEQKAIQLIRQISRHLEELRRVEGSDKLEKVEQKISEEIPTAHAAVRMGVQPVLVISRSPAALLHFADWLEDSNARYVWKVKEYVEVNMGPKPDLHIQAAKYINEKMAPQTPA